MKSRTNPIQFLVARILQKPKYVWYATIPLSCFDFTSWIALTIVMLVILRFGIKSAWNLMCANFVVHGMELYLLNAHPSAWLNATLDFWPGYLAAFSLLYFRSWVAVAYAIILTSFVLGIGVDYLFPHYAALQLKQVISAANSLNMPASLFSHFFEQNKELSLHLIIGMHMLAASFNALISLSMSRSMQAQLVNCQDNYLQEILSLRGCRWLCALLMMSLFLLIQCEGLVTLYFLPTVLMCFFAVGISVAASSLTKYKVQIVMITIVLSVILLPYVFIPLFVVVGALDSVLNFRVLIARRLKQII